MPWHMVSPFRRKFRLYNSCIQRCGPCDQPCHQHTWKGLKGKRIKYHAFKCGHLKLDETIILTFPKRQ